MARLAATLCLLLTAAFAAGCASAPAEPSAPTEAAEPMSGRTSVGPQEDAPAGPTKVVPISSHDVLGTPGIDHVFGVDLPAGTLVLRASLVIDSGAVQDLRLGLPDCRLLHIPSASTPVAMVTLSGECEPSESGLQQATLTFAAGAFVGTLQFEAIVPA